ncbi:hypothetical protein ACFY93_25240 [Streptomyces sp. NPDC008313]|uniref:hypothetical protein n=1 Tax=Streptomyces sp. NPDC008313 TaxID=3364826 RepID=UPI0036EBBBA7
MQEQGPEFEAQESRDESGVEPQEPAGHKDNGRRARILAGLTVGTLVVTAVASGFPTPTVVSWA